MGKNIAHKLIESHLVEGQMIPGQEIGIKIDQTLTQDATGTMVMLELEAMGLKKAQTEISAQYVDHNLVQDDFKNADDHLFLQSACQKFGIWYSRAGNGVSHPVHMERFGKPFKTLLGSDSHTPAAGSLGMLAMGAGGLEVALAIAGNPYHLIMPKVLGVRLVGKLPAWVSAKDIVLEMLRRHDVKGAVGWIIEYFGPGLKYLTAMDRHVIANMGTEMGATTTTFPADETVRAFLASQGRENDFVELLADEDATYDEIEEVDLSALEPMIALPSSPGNVVPLREVVGRKIYQSMVGSSANPGFCDFAIAAEIVKGKTIHPSVSFDINPSSRQILEDLTKSGHLESLVTAGGRIHQAGCNGCIGMGQAPATGKNSLRTVPRNFPGRSGTKEDSVYLCGPEVAAASALKGEITDPRTLGIPYPQVKEPCMASINLSMLQAPLENGESILLEKGPNIQELPIMNPLKENFSGPVSIKLDNNISTDEILPGGSRVLPFRSNIPEIAKFTFYQVHPGYYEAVQPWKKTGHMIVGGNNYGQGSSREHAAMAPRYLGVEAVLVKSFARIHKQNLVNFGIIPLTFKERLDFDTIDEGDVLEIKNLRKALSEGTELTIHNKTKNKDYIALCEISERQNKILLSGGAINLFKHN
jgi:aconitate hydratase